VLIAWSLEPLGPTKTPPTGGVVIAGSFKHRVSLCGRVGSSMSRSPHYGYALFGGDHSAKPRGQTKAPLHLGVEAGKGRLCATPRP
jgi:hypothetical protein